jgi:hypothetical protein
MFSALIFVLNSEVGAMRPREILFGLLLLGLLAARPAKAQFVDLARCHAAYPCAIPFGLQYHPDPLVAGPYGQPGNTGLSAHVELKLPLKVELDRPVDQKALDEALRKSLEIHGKEKETPPPQQSGANPPPKNPQRDR